MAKLDTQKVDKEISSFLNEYPDYTAEQVDDYISILSNFNYAEIDLFMFKLGY